MKQKHQAVPVDFAVALTGATFRTKFQGRAVEVTSFIGCPKRDDEYHDQGLGVFIAPGKTLFSGSKTKNPEVLWRGMKLLEMMPEVSEGIIYACLKGGNPKTKCGSHVFYPTYVLSGGYMAFNRFRREVLLMNPGRETAEQIERSIREAHRMLPVAKNIIAVSRGHFVGDGEQPSA